MNSDSVGLSSVAISELAALHSGILPEPALIPYLHDFLPKFQ